MTPILYVAGGLTFMKFAAVLIIISGYYGIIEVSTRMVDPIGWAKSDVDPEVSGILIERMGTVIMKDAETEMN
jgi:hypothetical protein